MPKVVAPSISETAFNCPHCGTLTSQFWYDLFVLRIKDNGTPNVWTKEAADSLEVPKDMPKDEREKFKSYLELKVAGQPFFEKSEKYAQTSLENVYVSHCFECKRISLWRLGEILWPATGLEIDPNPDLPADVRADFEEAGRTLVNSPRASAALLRLAVQRLCVHLGERGKNIDQDIGSLVSKGLDPRVQMALDVVRVVGNNAVHPGQIDLKDDRETAQQLFSLVNLIAEIRISQPKHIHAMYDKLPPGALEAIEKRDGPKQIGRDKPDAG